MASGYPIRADVADVDSIKQALERDGCVVVTGLVQGSEVDWQKLAASIPKRVFQEALKYEPVVAGVHLEHKELDKYDAMKDLKMSFEQSGLLPHTDGYIYGDHFPDYILLLMEEQSPSGGESFVVDGEKVLKALQEDEEAKKYLSLMENAPVDLTERLPAGIANGRESFGPVFQRCNDRLRWRRQVSVAASAAAQMDTTVGEKLYPYQSLWTSIENDEEQKRMLEIVDRTIQQETQRTPRFKVQNGEALIVDNYRSLHGREGFTSESERKLWRIWVWTDDSLGMPPNSVQISTTLEAEKLHAKM